MQWRTCICVCNLFALLYLRKDTPLVLWEKWLRIFLVAKIRVHHVMEDDVRISRHGSCDFHFRNGVWLSRNFDDFWQTTIADNSCYVYYAYKLCMYVFWKWRNGCMYVRPPPALIYYLPPFVIRTRDALDVGGMRKNLCAERSKNFHVVLCAQCLL